MATPLNSETDLITQKTQEFDNLPGLILGLDGWILRSLPKELRAQFLNGYEKLLRIVFHPDRYSDEIKKTSRQNYLQSVNESVRYLLADDFAYEMTVDSVPTHKNPMVTLRNSVEVRDNIIARLDAKIAEITLSEKNQAKETLRLRNLQQAINNEAENMRHADYRLRLELRHVVKHFAVPIHFDRSEVKGHFITPHPGTLLDRIAEYSSVSVLNSFDESWIKQAQEQKWLQPILELVFKKTICRYAIKQSRLPGTYTLVGGMTFLQLLEYVRRHNNYPTSKLDATQVAHSIDALFRGLETEPDRFHYRMETYSFLHPFYSSNMMLLLRIDEPGKIPRHALFLATEVTSELSLLDAFRKKSKLDFAKFEEQKSNMRAAMQRLRREKKWAERKSTSLEKSLSKALKKLKAMKTNKL